MSKKRPPKRVVDRDHSARRMVRHAVAFLRDAEVIQEVDRSRHRGGYLLRLTALEILLKAGIVVLKGEVPETHDFRELFLAQGSALQDRVREVYRDRELWRWTAGGATVEEQLSELGRNFIAFRYLYEASFPLTEQEDETRIQSFLDESKPRHGYDIVYNNEILDAALRAALITLEAWRDDSPPLRLEECDRGTP